MGFMIMAVSAMEESLSGTSIIRGSGSAHNFFFQGLNAFLLLLCHCKSCRTIYGY